MWSCQNVSTLLGNITQACNSQHFTSREQPINRKILLDMNLVYNEFANIDGLLQNILLHLIRFITIIFYQKHIINTFQTNTFLNTHFEYIEYFRIRHETYFKVEFLSIKREMQKYQSFTFLIAFYCNYLIVDGLIAAEECSKVSQM